MHIATIAKHYNVGYTEFKIRRMRREKEGNRGEGERGGERGGEGGWKKGRRMGKGVREVKETF